jgi:hypothetical protein
MRIAAIARQALLEAAVCVPMSALASMQPGGRGTSVTAAIPGALLVAAAALVVILAVIVLRTLANRQPDHGLPTANVPLRHGPGHPARRRLPARQESSPADVADAHGIEVREHLDAEELAMALTHFGPHSIGSPQGGAFAAAHPREALEPWLKLLDLYRQTGARGEFETMARRLNSNFNVRVPGWDQSLAGPGQDGDTIEAYPHVIKTLERLWHREACRNYLGALLVDTRGGTRVGFSKAAMDEILLLVAIQDLRSRRARSKRRAHRRTRKVKPHSAS